MAGSTSETIIVTQAEGGDAVQNGVVVDAPGAVPLDQTHATTEAHAGADAGAHEGAFPPFDPAGFGGQLLWLAITFVFLYVVLSRAALPRIGGILESRRVRIEGDLKEADRLRQETERAAAAYEQALAEARTNAHKIAEETRTSIRADIDNKRAGVEADLSKRVADAEARITKTKTAALGNVDGIAAETAAVLVEKLAGKVTAAEAKSAVAAVTRELAS